jgi:hypothetical protein
MGPNVGDVLGEVDAGTAAAIRIKLPRLRYQMRHGKWVGAIERMRGLYRSAGAVIEFAANLRLRRLRASGTVSAASGEFARLPEEQLGQLDELRPPASAWPHLERSGRLQTRTIQEREQSLALS